MRLLNPVPPRRVRDFGDRRSRVLALRGRAGRLRRIDPAAQLSPSPDSDDDFDDDFLRELAQLIARKKH